MLLRSRANRIRCVLLVAVLGASAGISAQQQAPLDSSEAIESGGRIFQTGCARCHGSGGDQVAGVTLAAGRFRHAVSDQELTRIVTDGIPLTGMPASNLSEQDAGKVVAYLRSLATGGGAAAALASLPGNLERGKALFETKGQCLTCHSVDNQGARLGLDLGTAGFGPADELKRSILEPDAEIKPDNRFVRIVTRSGMTVTGRLLNNDLFSVQLLEAPGRLRSFTKADIKEFSPLKNSLMPSYQGRLSADELTDIVKYLSSLRGRP